MDLVAAPAVEALKAKSDEALEHLPTPALEPSGLPEYARTPYLCSTNRIIKLFVPREKWSAKVNIVRDVSFGFASVNQTLPFVEWVEIDKTQRDYARNALKALLEDVVEHQTLLSRLSLGAGATAAAGAQFRMKEVALGAGIFGLFVTWMRSDEGATAFFAEVRSNAPKIINGLGEGTRVYRVLIDLSAGGKRTFLRDSRVLVNPDGTALELERCLYILKRGRLP
ncbi:hypothetical protein [Mesorhizobium sp. B2-8-5]|uniref:hypothetical protein n=1 Tax=Mesorhizobium sp. B2-8-5 TaxID=2589903 RepID=UPI0011709B6B|nr:hypothetical protein [Mesorhizobium sp. B2-8-5]UCI23975.1 hypothetical protein FJ430_20470 [Mesorhizobium sp. B2-8-5]